MSFDKQHLQMILESESQHSGVIVKGEKVTFGDDQRAIVDVDRMPRSPIYNPFEENGQPYIYYYHSDDEIVDLGNGYYRFAKSDEATEAGDQKEEEAADYSWYASNSKIKHGQGKVYPDDDRYWIDPGEVRRHHSSYGPKVTLERGLWRYRYYVDIKARSCGNIGNIAILYVDVVCNHGRKVLRGRRRFSWTTLCEKYGGHFIGYFYGDFPVPETTDNVEVRFDLYAPYASNITKGVISKKLTLSKD